MKKFLALFMAVSMLLTLAACGAKTDTNPGASNQPIAAGNVTLQIGVTTQATREDPFYLVAALTQEYVEEHGDGTLKIEVLANSQLGAEREMFEGQQLGTVDMSVISNAVVSNFIPACGMLDLPFLFDDYQMAVDFLTGDIGNTVMDAYEGSGVKALGMCINGFRQLVTVGKPVYGPEDMANMKIRCMENAIYLGTYQTLGANPLPMAWSEVIPALQQKTVEGLDGGVSVFYSSGFGDILDYITLTNQFCAANTVTISESVWNSLSADHQALLTEAVAWACAEELAFQEKNDAEKIDLMEAQGVTIIREDEVDYDAFRAALGNFYEEQKPNIGAEYVDMMLDAVASYSR
jgi:tripartite ATP-independent transporter DctP family solute receptor